MRRLTLLSVVMIQNVVAEDLGWVTTPFWRAPKISSSTIQLKAKDKGDLERNCREYKRRIEAEVPPYDREQIERYRTKDGLSSTGNFEATFIIMKNSETIKENRDEGVSLGNINLPFYYQSEAEVSFDYRSLNKIEIVSSPDSYTIFTKKLKLPDSEVFFNEGNVNDELVVSGKDIACDLYLKKATLKARVRAVVSITGEEMKRMFEFYQNKIQPTLTDVLINRQKESLVMKSALLGFRLSEQIREEENFDSFMLEKKMESLFKLLFKAGTLENSELVLNSVDGKKKEVLIPKSAVVEAINLEFKFNE